MTFVFRLNLGNEPQVASIAQIEVSRCCALMPHAGFYKLSGLMKCNLAFLDKRELLVSEIHAVGGPRIMEPVMEFGPGLFSDKGNYSVRNELPDRLAVLLMPQAPGLIEYRAVSL